MEENKKTTAPEKMSYEQLENIAHQLSEQSRKLYMKLQEVEMSNTFKRLDYLFKVLNYNTMFAEEFVKKCSSEIVELMTVPEPKKESKEEVSNEQGQ